MNGVYDASAPPPEEPPDAADLLRRLRSNGATTRLEAAMGRIDELAARLADKEAEEGETGLDAHAVQLLSDLTHDEAASLEWRSLGRRVDERLTSWEAFWARPQDEAGGLALFAAVLRDQAARTRAVLEEEGPA